MRPGWAAAGSERALFLAAVAIARVSGLELLVAHRSLSALAGALALVPVWYLVRRTAAPGVAGMTVVLLVAWPALVDVAPKLGPMWSHTYAGSEPTYLLFLFGSPACGGAGLGRRGYRAAALAAAVGALLALAYLTRAEAVLFGGVYVLVRSLAWIRSRASVRRGALALAAAGVGFVAVAGAHLSHLNRITGSWRLSGQPEVMRPTAETMQDTFRDEAYLDSYVRTWYRLYSGHSYLLNPYWGTADRVSREVQVAQFGWVAESDTPRARSWAGRVSNRLANYGYMLGTLSGPLFAPLVLAGMLAARRRQLPVFVTVGFAASLLTGPYLVVLPRLFLYLVPALALWAAYGVDWLAGRTGGTRFDPRRAMIGALLAVSLLMVGRRLTREPVLSLRFAADEDRTAAETLSAALPDADLVMHWHPRFASWADWEWRTLPVANLDAVAHYASVVGVRYLLPTLVGLAPIRAGEPHLLIVLDRELQDTLGSITPDERGRHTHPRMLLEPVAPVAGYPTGVLSLNRDGVEER